MPRKPKFRPKITRVKLNPEQAVLTCTCFSGGLLGTLPLQHSFGSHPTQACMHSPGRATVATGIPPGLPFYGFTTWTHGVASS